MGCTASKSDYHDLEELEIRSGVLDRNSVLHYTREAEGWPTPGHSLSQTIRAAVKLVLGSKSSGVTELRKYGHNHHGSNRLNVA